MGRDKRGVSAKFLQRELGVAYQTAWTMAHKLRHGLSENPARPLHGLLAEKVQKSEGFLPFGFPLGVPAFVSPFDRVCRLPG
jgi:hypothetical protein